MPTGIDIFRYHVNSQANLSEHFFDRLLRQKKKSRQHHIVIKPFGCLVIFRAIAGKFLHGFSQLRIAGNCPSFVFPACAGIFPKFNLVIVPACNGVGETGPVKNDNEY